MTFTATQIQDFAASFRFPETMSDNAAETVASLLTNKNGKVTGGIAKAEKISETAGISIGAASHIIAEAKEEQRATTGGAGQSAADARADRIFTTQTSDGRRQARRRG